MRGLDCHSGEPDRGVRRLRRFKKFLPGRETVERNRLLRPFAPLLDRGYLWHFNRRAVARGVAVGLFFGLIIPVAQIVFAAIAAVAFRANVPIAALSTLVTNPFTFPPIYFVAYRLGGWILGRGGAGVPVDAATQAVVQHVGWITRGVEWLSSVGPSLVVGLLVLAAASALAGFVTVHVLWRVAVVMRRRRSA
ncbi:MAG: DUF2062 domain-containing protein [Betaproteobacteria bacterium]|nr:DUF2062 domain-containing protein [Betaproteobacteria bacterium]